MGGSSGGYEDLVKKRELCSLPSFAHDPKFCGGQADSSDIGNVKAKAAQRLTDQKIIDQCVGDPIGTSALKDNCTHKWFSDFHPDACEWVSHQTGK